MPASVTPKPQDSVSESRPLLQSKCSRCHDLGRVYAVVGSGGGWVKTVVVMSDKEQGWTFGDSMKTIIRYRQNHPAYVERLFDGSCGTCHGWDELRGMKKTVPQWRTTLNYMARRCGDGLESHEREALYYAIAVL